MSIHFPLIFEEKNTYRCQTLMKELILNKYNCSICINLISKDCNVWFCKNCYVLFHSYCIRNWNNTLLKKKEDKDREFYCPACRKIEKNKKLEYYCFCEKNINQEYNTGLPHSCGNVCKRSTFFNCSHVCSIVCHPGPCPSCIYKLRLLSCSCDKNRYMISCGSKKILKICKNVCGRILNCKNHLCKKSCHFMFCNTCHIKHEFSTSKKRNLLKCRNEFRINNMSKGVFIKKFDLNYFKNINMLQHCGCNRLSSKYFKRRRRFFFVLPTCDKVCDQKLRCKKHKCILNCHEDFCLECVEMTELKCRCLKVYKKITCFEAKDIDNILFCKKICGKYLKCRKHRCTKICCPKKSKFSYKNHICFERCFKILNCNVHICDNLCHQGKCKPCKILLLNGLSCFCGFTQKKKKLICGFNVP